jgi:hypothetical protein
MGYWGTIVVARPQGRLIDQDGVAGFGHRHRWLRDLSDGWQLLETSGSDDPPDLRGPCQALMASTGHPVLAVYVSDSSCAAMCAASPGRVGPLTHLWPVPATCEAFRHQPTDMAEPAGRSLDDVVEELAGWSAAAGLPADAERLRAVIGRDDDEVFSQVDDLVFEVVKALGLTRIGRTLPWSLPAFDWPFAGVMFSLGPAYQARINGRHRAAGVKGIPPVQPWEPAALALETELWASLYRPDVEVLALARRAACLIAAYHAASEEDAAVLTGAIGSAVLDEPTQRLLARLESWLETGTVPAWSEELEARQHADARAT